MSTALIVGGDQIQGIRQVLEVHGIKHINHWSGRKVRDGNKVIPYDTELIVLVTDWISHKLMHKIKKAASRRSVRIVYTPNESTVLRERMHIGAI